MLTCIRSKRQRDAAEYALRTIQSSCIRPYIKTIYLYGSCARGEEKYSSDVDLFLELSESFRSRPELKKYLYLLKSEVSSEELDDAETDLKIVVGDSYFDFAENDFQYFKASYDAGIVANMMGAMAQGICEKYMKHLISEYYKPDDAIQQKDFENILRTHSLNRLMKFLKGNMGAEFSKNTQTHMRMIDGFYFSTRYPGDDSIEIDGDDVETCNDAIELCRKEVLELEQKLKKGEALRDHLQIW